MDHQIQITASDIAIYTGGVMLAIISFFIVRLVTSIDKIANDMGEIKVAVREVATRHENFEKELENHKEEIRIIKSKVFA